MGKTVVLVGGTGSGKTTLAKTLEAIGFHRIITYSTRQPRPGEVDGVDYNFISAIDFNCRKHFGFFAETTKYFDPESRTVYYYGSALEDYESDEKSVIILNPQGAEKVQNAAHIIWLDINQDILRQRCKERGWTKQKIDQRMTDDLVYFKLMKDIKNIDFHFTNVIPPMVMAAIIGQMIDGGEVLC